MENSHQDQGEYTPHNLLDKLLQLGRLKNDAALARKLGVAPPVISKIRNLRLPVGDSVMIRIHEEFGLSVKEMRELMGNRRLFVYQKQAA